MAKKQHVEKSLRVQKSSKEKFKEWLASKKEQGQRKGSGKGRGKGGKAGDRHGRGFQRDEREGGSAGRGRGKGTGSSKGRGRGGSEAPATLENPLSVEHGESFGAGKSLVEQLMKVKNKLVAATGEAAQSGAARAAPGAYAAQRWAKRAQQGKEEGVPDAKRQRNMHRPPVVREELVAANRRIGELAQTRDLAGIRKQLADLEDKGWANGHTYAAAVNAFCRCFDWQAARDALSRAESQHVFRRGGSVAASSGVVTRTSMIRGYCEVARDLERARRIFLRMEKDKHVEARPNTRTANTLLRGCLTLGAVDEAVALLERMENEWSKDETWCNEYGGAPDASSYEMVVGLLCQALRHKQASAVASRCLQWLGTSPGCATMFVAVARAAAVCKDDRAAYMAAKRAHSLLQGEENVGSDDEQVNSEVVGSGGKRGMVKAVEAGMEDDEERAEERAKSQAARTRSLQVFQSHRHADLIAELKSIDKSVVKERPIDLQWLWSRTLIIEDHNAKTEEETQSGDKGRKKRKGKRDKVPPDKKLVQALCTRLLAFGLRERGPAVDLANKIFKGSVRGGHTGRSAKPRKKRKKNIKQNSGEADAGGKPKVDLAALFQPLEGEAKQRPLHLEICSGGGEWICSQASRDKSACWVACELRFDRSARCFQRLALHGLATQQGNAGLVVGSACHALENCLQPSSCMRLFINHPEPPSLAELTPSEAADEVAVERPATHLLTASFLRNGCGAVLQSGGILTICTDSWEYGEWLLNVLAAPDMAEVFEDALQGTAASKQKRLARVGKVGLRGEPPPAEVCGAEYRGKAGSSYFQRLKKTEKSFRGVAGADAEERYFLCLRRRDAS